MVVACPGVTRRTKNTAVCVPGPSGCVNGGAWPTALPVSTTPFVLLASNSSRGWPVQPAVASGKLTVTRSRWSPLLTACTSGLGAGVGVAVAVAVRVGGSPVGVAVGVSVLVAVLVAVGATTAKGLLVASRWKVLLLNSRSS